MNDRITATCPHHQIPNPATGAPQPTPPPGLPFAAPILIGICPTVTINGLPAAVLTGAQELNVPPHVGLHLSDPYVRPDKQIGIVIQGKPTLLIGGMPAVQIGAAATCCDLPGTVTKNPAAAAASMKVVA
jgi:uncharacterized Zn-binding protein involved in type VI secretion